MGQILDKTENLEPVGFELTNKIGKTEISTNGRITEKSVSQKKLTNFFLQKFNSLQNFFKLFI